MEVQSPSRSDEPELSRKHRKVCDAAKNMKKSNQQQRKKKKFHTLPVRLTFHNWQNRIIPLLFAKDFGAGAGNQEMERQ